MLSGFYALPRRVNNTNQRKTSNSGAIPYGENCCFTYVAQIETQKPLALIIKYEKV